MSTYEVTAWAQFDAGDDHGTSTIVVRADVDGGDVDRGSAIVLIDGEFAVGPECKWRDAAIDAATRGLEHAWAVEHEPDTYDSDMRAIDRAYVRDCMRGM